MIRAEKLKKGDTIRVIAPSRSMGILGNETIEIAKNRLNDLGLNVTFGKHVQEIDDFLSSSIASRLEDLHDAFSDPAVQGILTVIGGFNSNQLLKYINYDLIRDNPKILCGFSDITALTTAIYTKTKLITYSGMHFSSFGMKNGLDFSIEYFCKCLMQNNEFILEPSTSWSNDTWWIDQDNREFYQNDGYKIINKGRLDHLEGIIIGGNISTLGALQGTEYFPSFPENTVLFIEECEELLICFFDRLFQSLIYQDKFKNVKAIFIGRFEKANKMTHELLNSIIKSKKELDDILVVSEIDFGHTTPMITFPIGGTCKVDLTNGLHIQIKG